MKNLKKLCVLFLFTILCSTVFAESTRTEIKEFFEEYKEMVSLAEKAVKRKSVSEMTKVEGLMTKLSVKYGKLVLSDDWTEKDSQLYKKLKEKYGVAHEKFTKLIGKDIEKTAKEFGKEFTDVTKDLGKDFGESAKDIGNDFKDAGKKLKKLFD
jgi:hypothetical protein